MSDLDDRLSRERRDERVADFAFALTVASVQSSMGRILPDDQTARDFVRIGRVIYSEIDQPTTPPDPARVVNQAGSDAAPLGDPGDLVDEFFPPGG